MPFDESEDDALAGAFGPLPDKLSEGFDVDSVDPPFASAPSFDGLFDSDPEAAALEPLDFVEPSDRLSFL